jgi:hypothetical protein
VTDDDDDVDFDFEDDLVMDLFEQCLLVLSDGLIVTL